ncbi:MAG TPA: hypothetical protein VGO90_15240 [Chthoniobacteraceae bacterium]|nr:rane protein [Chthoniobacter sp.]HEV7869040.1 hypothetical protein [Chthoniobacteraceae bacterium]
MSNRSEAEEHLRLIRSLMERANIYRAISAPAALLGGICSVLVAGAGLWLSHPWLELPGEAWRFAIPWTAVLLVTTAANFWLLRRGALRRGEVFISPGFRLALRAMLPALLGGAVCSVLNGDGNWALTASLWVLFYGISLLAASHFAPKSICWLGRAFFVAGVGLLLFGSLVSSWWIGHRQLLAAHAIMGATFGLFHLAYAAATWPRTARVESASGA